MRSDAQDGVGSAIEHSAESDACRLGTQDYDSARCELPQMPGVKEAHVRQSLINMLITAALILPTAESDCSQPMANGHSISGGVGLAGVRRLVDELEIMSEDGGRTVVTAKKWRTVSTPTHVGR